MKKKTLLLFLSAALACTMLTGCVAGAVQQKDPETVHPECDRGLQGKSRHYVTGDYGSGGYEAEKSDAGGKVPA